MGQGSCQGGRRAHQTETEIQPLSDRQLPQRTETLMTPFILDEFLSVVVSALRRFEYAIIGGAALAKYGSKRRTSNIDVMVASQLVDATLSHFIKNVSSISPTSDGRLG